MDKSTHEIRALNWAAIIEQCQARPDGQSAKQWLAANNVPEKQYYYWQRKLRKQFYEKSLTPALPEPAENCPPAVSFAEIPAEAEEIISSKPVTAVTTKSRKLTLEISSAVPASSMIEIVKAVVNAV